MGLDGSPTSSDNLSWALGEAKRCNLRVLTVYVVPTVELASALAAAGAPDGYAAIKQAETDPAVELKGEAEAQARRLGVPVVLSEPRGTARTS